MKIAFIGFAIGFLITMICLSNFAFAQEPNPTQTERPALQRKPPTTMPRTQAPASQGAVGCIYESKEYSVGANLCISSQVMQVCQPPDDNHAANWWQAIPPPPQPGLCGSAASPPTNISSAPPGVPPSSSTAVTKR